MARATFGTWFFCDAIAHLAGVKVIATTNTWMLVELASGERLQITIESEQTRAESDPPPHRGELD